MIVTAVMSVVPSIVVVEVTVTAVITAITFVNLTHDEVEYEKAATNEG